MSLLSKNAFICTETNTLIQEGVQKLCFICIMSDRMIKSVQGGESILSLVLLTTTRLNSVYHLIIYSGDNSERSLYERRH